MQIDRMRRPLLSCLLATLVMTLWACGPQKQAATQAYHADLSMYRSVGVVTTSTALDENSRKLRSDLEKALVQRLEDHGQFERVERWSPSNDPGPELKVLATISRVYRPNGGGDHGMRLEAAAEAIDVATGRGYGMVRFDVQGDDGGIFAFGGDNAINRLADQIIQTLFAPLPDAQ